MEACLFCHSLGKIVANLPQLCGKFTTLVTWTRLERLELASVGRLPPFVQDPVHVPEAGPRA